jgi:predicted nucleic acid-binding protein
MSERYILDACSLIAFFNDEPEADIVEKILEKAEQGAIILYMNKINILEIYYGILRDEGIDKAEEIYSRILSLPITVIDKLEDQVFKESGRMKAMYRISLTDSIALAEAKVKNVKLLTADHHEFDVLVDKGEVDFYWIR